MREREEVYLWRARCLLRPALCVRGLEIPLGALVRFFLVFLRPSDGGISCRFNWVWREVMAAATIIMMITMMGD